jgi:hypothetical protein
MQYHNCWRPYLVLVVVLGILGTKGQDGWLNTKKYPFPVQPCIIFVETMEPMGTHHWV